MCMPAWPQVTGPSSCAPSICNRRAPPPPACIGEQRPRRFTPLALHACMHARLHAVSPDALRCSLPPPPVQPRFDREAEAWMILDPHGRGSVELSAVKELLQTLPGLDKVREVSMARPGRARPLHMHACNTHAGTCAHACVGLPTYPHKRRGAGASRRAIQLCMVAAKAWPGTDCHPSAAHLGSWAQRLGGTGMRGSNLAGTPAHAHTHVRKARKVRTDLCEDGHRTAGSGGMEGSQQPADHLRCACFRSWTSATWSSSTPCWACGEATPSWSARWVGVALRPNRPPHHIIVCCYGEAAHRG